MSMLRVWPEKLKQDKGAALATVMLIVGVMAVAAVASFDAINYSVKRTTNQRLYQQARLYALGGEHIARRAAERIVSTNQAALAVVGFDGVGEINFPIEGGTIKGQIRDSSNCFNVNSLVSASDAGTLVGNPEMAARYLRLLDALAFSEGEAEALTASLTDWLDTDTRPSPRGAEDYDYALLSPAYRPANTLMVDTSEIALVSGYNEEVTTRLLPFLCVLPTTSPAKLNVNSLTVTEAPLLSALVGAQVDYARLQGVISERPQNGFDSVGTFWQQRVFEGSGIPQDVRAGVEVQAQQFAALITVNYYDAHVMMTSRIFVGNDGSSQILGRQFGVQP